MLPLENFEQYRPLLFSIAYRMLGSAMEAEDMVQDTYLRYSQADLVEVQSHKYYLTTIVTRLALNRLQSAQAQREMQTGNWLPEPILTTDENLFAEPSEHLNKVESISLAFLVLLEKLSPTERAVFLLREVFDYEYAEIAKMVEKSEEACRQIYSRAKKHLHDNRPRFETDPKQHENLLLNFLKAMEEGKIEGLLSLLAEDAMIVSDGGKRRGWAKRPILGAPNVAKALFAFTRYKELYPSNLEIKPINGKPTLVLYLQDGSILAVVNIELEAGKIKEVHIIADEEKLKCV